MNIIREQFLQNVAQTSPSPLLIEVERAEGIYLYTPEGKRYVDLVSGVSVSNVGHGNPKVVEAVCEQTRRYMHCMVYGELVEKPQVQYAALLAEHLPEPLRSVYFVNSGAEAIEGAMKLAKRYTSRSEIISFRGAYHGSTQGAMSIMGGEFFKTAYRPLLPDTRLIDYNNFADLEQITERTACVVAECVQGEHGIRLPVDGYLQALRRRCTEVGALLVFDEVQTGFGRCGAMFAMELSGVTPDIVCLAKALGGGMPLGAFVSSNQIMGTLTNNPVLGHITTFGGHPVCCAAGKAAMEYILENDLVARAARMGELFEQELKEFEIRRCGLLIAVELGTSERMFEAVRRLTEAGYMTDWFLFCETAFRISPPLTITEQQVKECSTDIRQIVNGL